VICPGLSLLASSGDRTSPFLLLDRLKAGKLPKTIHLDISGSESVKLLLGQVKLQFFFFFSWVLLKV